jgi:tRNA A37 methylthiotransferase MiaB
VKKDRNRRLLALAERVQRTRLERYAGTSVRAFVESTSERDPRVLLGRTVHGVPVSFRGAAELVGTTVELAIDETTAYGMAGRVPEPVGR